jgi:hypothetical protein
VLRNERRPGRIVIEKQRGMEVLGAYLSLSVSIKDRTIVATSVEIERIPNHLAGQISHFDCEVE